MSEDVLIPKMKRLDKNKKTFHMPWLNLAIIIFFTLTIVASTFLNLNIRHFILPPNLFAGKQFSSDDFIQSIYFIPQIPIIMFVCSVLGKRMALSSIVLYILIGLFFAPVFALGGGVGYVAEYGFGYIFAYIPAVVIAGNILRKKYSFPNMIRATLLGVLLIHIIGIMYMIGIVLVKQTGWDFIRGWVCAQSGIKILYDLIYSFVLILIGKYLHSGLKFILE